MLLKRIINYGSLVLAKTATCFASSYTGDRVVLAKENALFGSALNYITFRIYLYLIQKCMILPLLAHNRVLQERLPDCKVSATCRRFLAYVQGCW